MGSFKKWFEEIAVGSDGQSALPTQVAQDTVGVANKFMNDPKNGPMMAQMSQLTDKPTLLNKFAIKTVAPTAVKTSGIPQSQVATNSPAVAGQIIKSVAPKMNNPFANSIKPV
jgi:hypothetical protein